MYGGLITIVKRNFVMASNDIIRLPKQTLDLVTTGADRSGRINDILGKLEIEGKIKEGAENLLQVFDTRKLKDGKEEYKQQIEQQLDAANAKIQLLRSQLSDLGHSNSSFENFSKNNNRNSEERRSESPTWSLGDILQSFESPKQDSAFLIARANEFVSLLQRHPLLKYDLVMAQVGDKIRLLILHKQTEVVAAGYRVARNSITGVDSIKQIRALEIDYLIIRTLTKDYRCQIERIQAIRLVRSFLDIPGGVLEISVGVIRAFVALAEQSDDSLRNICIETLAEIFVQYPSRVSEGGGIRVLLQSIVEGPFELSQPITLSLIHVLDSPANRKLVRDGRDLDYLISAFTDMQIRGHVHSERLENSARVLAMMLRSWTGLFILSVNNFKCIRNLLECFLVPLSSLRDVLLDLMFSIFCIRPLSWSSSFVAGRRLTTFGRVLEREKKPNEDMSSSAADCQFMDEFTAVLLSVMIQCGLIERLVTVVEGNEDLANTRKATLLLGEVLALSGRLSTSKYLFHAAALPQLFNSAIVKSSSDHRHTAAATAILQIEKISRNLHKRKLQALVGTNLTVTTISNEVRLKIGYSIDDYGFKQLLADTQVLSTKTYTKWNWDALTELIKGPLLNPKRLDEAIKLTKFMKRLLSFYRPFKYRFSSIKRTKPNQKYIEVGQSLLETLLYNPEGVKYLTENKLLRQIAECFAQLDPMSGITSADPLFSSQRLQNTLSYGYFSLLGTLSKDRNGLTMIERWRMFNMFYHFTELNNRDDLIINFISSMDYRLPGHPRIILEKALTTGHKEIRLFATGYLRTLIRPYAETHKWIIRLLLTQLYDPSVEVCRLAVEVLELYCNIPENLEYFAQQKPVLDHLGEIGTPLLLQFLSTSSGFKYLKDLNYIHAEMDNWFHGLNDSYVRQIEEYLESRNMQWLKTEDKTNDAPSVGAGSTEYQGSSIAPRHFYGELTLTEDGCQLLQSKRHFQNFVYYIRENKYEDEDVEILTKLKGCLWAVGNICSNPLGTPFLEESRVIDDISQIVRCSLIYSLRGTAWFALGLISSTEVGAEILDEYGWNCVRDTLGNLTGICIPTDLEKILDGYKPVRPVSKDNTDCLEFGSLDLNDDTKWDENYANETEFPSIKSDPVKQKILTAISNLSNQILANEASKQLVRLQAKYRSKFQSVDLFMDTMNLLDKYRYKLPVRRFIFELFDTATLMEWKMRKQKALQRRGRPSSDTKIQGER